MNRIQLLGNLGTDPEPVNLRSNVALCHLNVATTERGYVTKDGVQVPERTTWHQVNAWGPMAQACLSMLQKGSRVYVEGILHSQTVDKDGQKLTYWSVDASAIEFLSGLKPKQQMPGDYPPPPETNV